MQQINHIPQMRRLTKTEAANIVDKWDQMSDDEFAQLKTNWPSSISENLNSFNNEIRECLVSAYERSLAEPLPFGIQREYLTDLRVGIAIYKLLDPSWFTYVYASDDMYWRYLSVCVIPDITNKRYPDAKAGDIRINKKRFFTGARRIWIKSLWWYIHLSWQGDDETTFQTLCKLSNDAIEHLIGRTGIGYRVEEYRELVRQYSQLPHRTSNSFRRLAARNLAMCHQIEPELYEGGIEGFVRMTISTSEIGA